MGKTNIEWTEATWNPLAGCTAKSPGCLNCYAATMSGRLELMGQAKYAGVTITRGKRKVFNGLINYDEKALIAPLHRKKPTVFFVNSMSDLFWGDEDDLATARRLGVADPQPVPFEFIDRVFAVMALTPLHIYQVLTKRPERMKEYLNDPETPGRIAMNAVGLRKERNITFPNAEFNTEPLGYGDPGAEWFPLCNVWLGVSVEDQKTADERIPLLLDTPAATRWISAEPLLGPLNVEQYLYTRYLHGGSHHEYERLDWGVIGGESGLNARPMHPDWARSLRTQFTTAGVPFFFKQWGEWNGEKYGYGGCDDPCGIDVMALPGGTITGTDWEAGPAMRGALQLHRVGKKKAGRLLDGREWNEMPEVTAG